MPHLSRLWGYVASVLLCIGDLYEEILVGVSEPLARGAETSVRSARIRGGSAANVAAISSEMGAESGFVGQVGDDSVGRTLVDDLKSRGVHTMVHHSGGTGVAITLVGDGRSRLIDRGASRRLHSIRADILEGVSSVYLAASVFTEDPLAAAVDHLMGEIHDRRIQVTLGGPGAADLKSLGAEAFLELVEAIRPDTVIMNSTEHERLGLLPRAAIPGADNSVITSGRRPSVVIPRRGEATSVEVRPVDKVRDHTGVGDGFIAGYIASRATGADAASATNAGHRIAAKVLRNLGPTTQG